MCCFLVPGAEAAALSIASLALHHCQGERAVFFRDHINRLSRLLWGGSLLLALEHIWHGEIMFAPPFITAMQSPEDTEVMIAEMSTSGVAMAVLVTLAYLVFALVRSHVAGRTGSAAGAQE
ncbi:hypothetical protein [Succinimonas amylolytica]|uniref:hypothetical protein n=1 Tax=Succinimonas amylolytica TaxID=83769 RepID=UPI0003773BA8|nr:hypothetical protein [Succinimonas amylolytica]